MPRTINVRAMKASNETAEEVLASIAERIDGPCQQGDVVSLTGRFQTLFSGRILAAEATVDDDADVDDVWLMLTSYGLSPSPELGSVWETVEGVGC